MKKVVFLVFFLMCIIVYVLRTDPEQLTKNTNFFSDNSEKRRTMQLGKTEVSVFVPYWVLTAEALVVDEYQKVLYFGVVPTDKGTIDTTEPGYTNLRRFTDKVAKGTDTYLVLRMLDSDTNFTIIENKELKKQVIHETLLLAAEHGFSGVVLDLELSALPFDSVVKNITAFTTEFSQASKAESLSFSMTMYADAYYRFRPYNIAEIGKQVDTLYLMTYDFHKARGNPGPNFPFSGKETYGYDFQAMIGDFMEDVPAEKLSVIFGMYGYDWEVDGKGKAFGQAESMSLYKIQQQFIKTCSFTNCTYNRDSLSTESNVTYTDEGGKPHSIWFEDEASVARKKEYLKENGISKTSYWAYSYF